jgi:hypothetical protein
LKHPTHPPNIEPHPALKHLVIRLTPDEYRGLIISHRRYEIPESAWAELPNYVIARCPLCQATYTAVLDTYSLESWRWHTTFEQARYVFDFEHQKIGCNHFFAVQTFLNLNGYFPEERSKYFHSDYDVPFISPLFIPEEVPAYAVMHSLPICRIENDTFVPRYSMYMLTYFAPEPYVRWRLPPNKAGGRRLGILYERRVAAGRFEHQDILYFPSEARQHSDWWDLPYWIKKKKLFWLDPASPDLPLINEPVEKFPYANIQGYRRPIEIRNGKFRFLD